MKKLLLAFAGLLVASVLLLSRIAAIPADCHQPCGDPPNCRPIELKLVAKFDRIPGKDKTFMVWYRTELVNRSCFQVSIPGHEFLDGDERFGALGLSVQLQGPDDTVVMPLDKKIDGVAAYQNDEKAHQETMASGLVDAHWTVRLGPGQSIATIPSVLDPYKEEVVHVDVDGYRGGSAMARISAPPPPGATPPPPGMRALGRFQLRQPGVYKVQALFKGSTLTQTSFPRWERLPRTIQRILRAIDMAPNDPLFDLELLGKSEVRTELQF